MERTALGGFVPLTQEKPLGRGRVVWLVCKISQGKPLVALSGSLIFKACLELEFQPGLGWKGR